MIDHRVNVAGGHQKAQPRLTEFHKRFVARPVGLRYHADLIAVGFQHACDDRRAEGRMIDVGVAADIDEIGLRPAALFHFFTGYR